MKRVLALSLCCFVWLSFPSVADAQYCGGGSPYMMIVLDKSGSMSSSNKWNLAKTAINNMISQNNSIWYGLLLFTSSCSPGISVGCGANTHSAIMNVLNSNSPGGGTEVGGGIKRARTYLQGLSSSKKKYIVVVTDGCSSTGCGHYATEAASANAAGIKVFAVGFGTGACPSQLSQIASSGGTGSYYNASNGTALNAALKSIAGQVSCCGNGVLDTGEKCDIAAPAGSPNACPKSCNDGNSCTYDQLTGKDCLAACLYTAITHAGPADGCCPAGASSLTDPDCTVVCGNGLLEAGEKCDPGITVGPGKCPTTADCNDLDPCTADALAGSGCHVTCSNTPKTASGSTTDGCCPAGATSLTDKDCPAACGNGLLESGETCDPGIASGVGKCPTLADCDDNDKCTADTLSGGACSRKCLNTTIAANATTKDGCCPKGANSKTDKDCPPLCGNGIIEAGELCDTGVLSGPGVCPTLSSCDDGDKCTIDALTGTACAVKCSNTKKGPNATTKDGCCPKGYSLKQDADCLPPCGPDKTTNCIDLCQGVTCPSGHYCNQGKCIPFTTQDQGTGTGNEDSGPVLPNKDSGGTTSPDAGVKPFPKTEAGMPKPFPTEAGVVIPPPPPPKYTEAGVFVPPPDMARTETGAPIAPKTEAGIPIPPWTEGGVPLPLSEAGTFLPRPEAGTGPGPGNPANEGTWVYTNVDGCACQTGGGAASLPVAFLVLFGILFIRRRVR